MADKKITRQLSIFINGKKVENSLGGIGREIAKVKKQLKEANDPTDIKKYKAELDKLGAAYGDVKEEVDGTNKALDEGRAAWDNLISGFISGNPKQISEGISGITSNIKGMTKAALSFIATPIGLAVAAVAAIGLGIKEWVSYNLEIEKTNQLVRDLTQESGTAVDDIRVRAETLNKFFDVDLKESIETAKSLSKGFGISYAEAFDIIEDGAVRGKLSNDDYLDSLREYPVLFKQGGFSAQEFADIVSAGVDLSIYSDKLPDAIKEFTLSVTEQTPAAKEALENAFGPAFTNKLFKGLQDGSITAKESLALIAEEAENVGLNSQQAQLLTADLFKGAGEDAGGAIKIFEAVNMALNDQKKPLTELQEIQAERIKTENELNNVQTQLFASGSKGFGLLIEKGKLFASQTLLKILKAGVDVYNWVVDLNNESSTFSAILSTIGKLGVAQLEILMAAWNNFGGVIGGYGDVIEGIFNRDLDKIKGGLAKSGEAYVNFFSDIKDSAVENFDDIQKAWQGGVKLERVTLDSFISDDTLPDEDNPDPIVTPPDNAAAADEEELTPEDKKILDSKKKLAEFLDQFEEERALLKQIEGLEKDEADQLEEELRLEAKYAKLAADAAGEKELLARLEEAKKTELEGIEDKYDKIRADKDAKLKGEELKRQQEHNKKLAADRKKLQNDIINGAIKLAGAETKVGQALVAAKGVLAAKEMLIQLGVLKGKAAAASAEATVATSTGAANTLSVGFPQNVPLILAFAAQAVGIIAAVKSATKAASSISTPSFYSGGFTGDKILADDEYGGIVGAVHADEWVAPKWMNDSPRYAPTIKWLEQERTNKTATPFFDGGYTSADTNAANSGASVSVSEDTNNASLMQMLQTLNAKLDQGFKGYIVRDYEDFITRKEIDQEHQDIYNTTRT